MSFFNILNLLGGLALFLFGMDYLGKPLARASGNALELTLGRLTNSRIKGVLLGAGVTAVIQSSSGTTVMVVGLVNSGLMKLRQAVGVIMGANIGTTVTSWILSLAGIESENFFVSMLKPSSFSPIVCMVGVVIQMFSKKASRRNVADIMIGFSVLMFGMQMMSDTMKPLAEMPEFTRLFTLFTNPIVGILVGAGLTAIIQSSSASVGILQALCATGAVPFSAALPIIMGQNIGTCITALLSSIGASKNAKRAALIHLLFNLLGTTIFTVAFYVIHAISPFAFFSEAATYQGIAVLHTTFNIATTVLLFPFARGLERIACLLIPDKMGRNPEEDNEFKLLDPRFLEQPALAVEQAHTLLGAMARLACDAFEKACGLIGRFDEDGYMEVEQLENRCDRYEDEVGSYLVKISSRELSPQDSHLLTIMMSCINDFERISDHAMNVAQTAKRKADEEVVYSPTAMGELSIYMEAVHEIIELSIDLFVKQDKRIATQVESLEMAINRINKQLNKRHIRRLRRGLCSIESGLSFMDVLTNFERIGDHCSNIAESVVEISQDSLERHELLPRLQSEGDTFTVQYKAYKKKYSLPKLPEAMKKGGGESPAEQAQTAEALPPANGTEKLPARVSAEL